MKTIDIQAIIDAEGLDKNKIAEQLFPTNQYPRLALNRVIAGKAELDASQISRLASLAGMTFDELYGENWKAKSKDGIHKFTNGDYTAELDTNTWITKVFHNSSMLHESVLHSKDLPLSEYFILLNKIIKNENS